MRKYPAILAIVALPLASCGEADKSVEYYMQHDSEAREKAARCHANGDAGENCGNAAVALQRLAREKFDRDNEQTREEAETRSWRPTWNGQ